jgi:hypothetical protein
MTAARSSGAGRCVDRPAAAAREGLTCLIRRPAHCSGRALRPARLLAFGCGRAFYRRMTTLTASLRPLTTTRGMAAVAMGLVLGLTACLKTNPQYCCDDPVQCADTTIKECQDGLVCDLPTRGCVEPTEVDCAMSSECTPAAPHCVDEACQGTCVGDESCEGAPGVLGPYCEDGGCEACRAETEASDCGGAAPVCGDDFACRACASHGECASGVCLGDGSCGDASQVVWVTTSGDASNDCLSEAEACDTVERALEVASTEGRAIVRIGAGTFPGLALTPVVSVTLIGADLDGDGAPTTTLDANGGAGVIVQGGSTIGLEQVTITSGSGGLGGDAVNCAGSASTVLLRRVQLTGNSGSGIDSDECTFTATQSVIADNNGGGIVNTGGSFTITNNFIFRNGDDDEDVGGCKLDPDGASSFEFNTVVYNLTVGGGTRAGGVVCDDGTFTANNNVIYANTTGGVQKQTVGDCDFGTSRQEDEAAGNPLGFVSPTVLPFNYHLVDGSPLIGEAGPSDIALDVDGDLRPGNGADLGADQFVGA